jgi:transcriptional regulator GlxA family with amidase domain
MLDLVRFWSDAWELLADAPDAYADAGRPEWLTRACLAMRREANLRGGVPRLLELASVSPAHLSRSMRLHNGVTPTQFVASLRLEHAATLLAAGSATVTEIAYRCGFSSQSYFTRCFRDAHGLSPRTFRQQARRAFVP